jgi:hypothetical protein
MDDCHLSYITFSLKKLYLGDATVLGVEGTIPGPGSGILPTPYQGYYPTV